MAKKDDKPSGMASAAVVGAGGADTIVGGAMLGAGAMPTGGGELEAGAEFKPGGYSPDIQASLQKKLIDTGLLDRRDVPELGHWNPASAAAMKMVLAAAAGSGLSTDAVIAMWAGGQGMARNGSQGPTKQPLVISLTNPEDVRAMAEQLAVRTIGRKLNDDEVAPLIDSFHALQRTAQEQAYEASGSGLPGGPGGTVVDPPNAQAFTQQRIEAEHPQEAASYGMVGRYAEFRDLLDSVQQRTN